MALLSVVTINHGTPEAAAGLARFTSGDKSTVSARVEHLFAAFAGGIRAGSFKYSANAVQAAGTLTLSSAANTNTCTINGVTFTLVTSGATGNQANVGGSDAITAANLAAAINASVTAKVAGYVSATSSGAVVTIAAVQPGLSGNMFTLAGGTNITASGSALSGGLAGTEATYVFGV